MYIYQVPDSEYDHRTLLSRLKECWYILGDRDPILMDTCKSRFWKHGL